MNKKVLHISRQGLVGIKGPKAEEPHQKMPSPSPEIISPPPEQAFV